MTTNFVSAAQLMGKVLGAPTYQFAVIDHPISSATDMQLRTQAETSIEVIRRIILVATDKREEQKRRSI